MTKDPDTTVDGVSPVDETELSDRVASLEYAGAVRALLPFVIPAMLVATLYIVAAAGPGILLTYAVFPVIVVFLAVGITLYLYFSKKDFDPLEKVAPRDAHLLVYLALARSFGLGAFNAIALTMVGPEEQTALLMGAVMAGTLSLTTNVRAITLAFGLPNIFLVWGMTLWLGVMNFWLAMFVFSVMTGLIILSSTRARAARWDLMRLTLSSESAIQDQLTAAEKLRIAEQKAAKKDMEQQAAARQMQENLIAAIAFSVVLSEGDEILVATPETLRQFKIRKDVAEDHTMSQYFVDPRDQQRIIDILREQGKIDNCEVLMHDREGEQFWVAVSLRPLIYDGRNCWLNSIYNIDARKHMEQDLAAAKESAEAAVVQLKDAQQSLIHAEKMASLGQLTAGIAHEIKNPLNFVNNFSKLAAEMMDELADVLAGPIASLDEEDRDDAEDLIETVKSNLLKIDEHGHRADSIVKNMLQHSREGTGDKQAVDLNALAEEAMNLAYHGARANDQSFNITLETDLSHDIGEVECIPQELQRVILNLCTNGMYEAAKNAVAGGEPAMLRVCSRVDDTDCLIEVTDNGGGVPEDLKEKIFQPFFTTKPTGEGTGLGLSMSYDIIKQHGGELSLTSETGKGTTFQIRLPR